MHAESVTQGQASNFDLSASNHPVHTWSRQDMHDHLFLACDAIQFVKARMACVVIRGDRQRVLFAQPHDSIGDLLDGLSGLRHRLRGYARDRELHVEYVGTVLPLESPDEKWPSPSDILQRVQSALDQGNNRPESNVA